MDWRKDDSIKVDRWEEVPMVCEWWIKVDGWKDGSVDRLKLRS